MSRQIEAARRAFYKGFVADAIDRFYRTELMDSTGARHRGLLSGDDLARYAARVELTLSVDYHGVTVHKIGPWSQGPMLLQTLRLLERTGIATMDPVGPDFVHTLVEALKLASPTARCSTAIQMRSTCRCRRCCRINTRTRGRN